MLRKRPGRHPALLRRLGRAQLRTRVLAGVLLIVNRPGATREKYWIDPQQLQVIRGQLF